MTDRFRITLIPEGVDSVDGRHIRPGALTTRQLPLPLLAAASLAENVLIGQITSLTRDGDDPAWWSGEGDLINDQLDISRMLAAYGPLEVGADLAAVALAGDIHTHAGDIVFEPRGLTFTAGEIVAAHIYPPIEGGARSAFPGARIELIG